MLQKGLKAEHLRAVVKPLTIILPSILMSVCSKSQTWIFCLLCKNLKIKFCSSKESHHAIERADSSKRWRP